MTGGYVGYSFAVLATLWKIFEDIIEYGDVQKGLLGVRGVALKSSYSRQLNINETEVYIDEIEEGFGADSAGLTRGIIKSVDGLRSIGFQTYLDTYHQKDLVIKLK